jgi:hypothetical protein
MKTYGGFLYLGIIWRVVIFTLLMLYPEGRSSCNQVDRRLGVLQSRSVRYGQVKKKILTLPGLEIRPLGNLHICVYL